jgi:hypothetical protein
VQFLERRGVNVDRSPTDDEGRNLAADINEAVVQMVATGSVMAIAAGCDAVPGLLPSRGLQGGGRAPDTGPDDGGFLDE